MATTSPVSCKDGLRQLTQDAKRQKVVKRVLKIIFSQRVLFIFFSRKQSNCQLLPHWFLHPLVSGCSRQDSGSKVFAPSNYSCAYAILIGKRDFADVIKVTN